jgi:hypothetical protein
MRCRLLLLIQVSLLIPADAFVAGPTTTQQKFQVRRLLVAATTEENDMTDPKSSRWALLDPAVKAKIIERGQERAIQNKAKRESPQEQKRRTYFIYAALSRNIQLKKILESVRPFLLNLTNLTYKYLNSLATCNRNDDVYERKTSTTQTRRSRRTPTLL